MELCNKIDFAVVLAAKNANPNGDPLDGNRPRTDFRGFGEMTDVCLKRKIRNRLLDMGENIFVQSDDRRVDSCRSLKERVDGCKELKNLSRDAFGEKACETWLDVRAFGQVFSFKDSKKKGKGKTEEEDGDGSDAVSLGIRGPVTIQSAFSVDPVNITSTQITKSVNLETGSDPDKKGSDTMGMKHRVDFGLYVTYGSINVQQAKKTGFTVEDTEKLKEAIRTLFVNDETSARPAGSMEVVKLVWWQHNNQIGQYAPTKVHHLLEIHRKEDVEMPMSVEDYQITIQKLPDLACEVIDGL